MDTVGSLLDLADEQEYAKATVEFRKARSAYYRARARLIGAIDRLGRDPDNLIDEAGVEEWPVIVERRDQWSLRHKIPLPATLPEIRSYMGWTTERTHEWLKRQQAAGYVMHNGPRRHYVYYYTEKYNLRAGLIDDSVRQRDTNGTGSDGSVNELSGDEHAETSRS